MLNFKDKVVIVTGGAGFLGSVVANKFLERGAKVIILDIIEDKVNNKAMELGDNCFGLKCDLTDENEIETTVETIINRYDTIDILANIAGGFTMGGRTHETGTATLEKMLDFNFRTMYNLSRRVIPVFLEKKYGKIINIGARAGLEGVAQMGPYVGSKSMVIRATETMAKEYKNDNINVNCILPGTIDQAQNRADMPDADFDKWVKPSQLANVIMFLASDEANAIHGASIPVYGKGY